MEELRSTEVLDGEILEDARKKANRILKNADATLATQKQDWEKKTQEAVDSIRKTYAERTKNSGDEVFARLPLDKRRLRLEISEKFLVKAMNDFLRSLPKEKLLFILENELLNRLETIFEEGEGTAGDGAKPEFYYSGMDLSEARKVLERVFASLKKKSGGRLAEKAGDWILKEDVKTHEFPSFIFNIQAVKLNASVEAAAVALLEDKRAELAAALLGEGVLND